METGRTSDTTLDKPLSDERRGILRSAKRDLVRDMDAHEVLLHMTAENIFNTTEEEKIKLKPTRSEKNEQFLDILTTKGEKAYRIFKETLRKVHPPLANVILEREKKDLGGEKQADGARQAPDSNMTRTTKNTLPEPPRRAILEESFDSLSDRRIVHDQDMTRTTKNTLPEPLRRAILEESFDSLSDRRIVHDQVFAETISIPQEKIKKRIIFSDLVPEEGFTWILKETGILVKFFPKAVPDPRLVTCSLWKPGIISLLLEDNESLVSNVIELDCDDPHDVVFSSIEVALSHSAICVRGYELVLKEMADPKGLRWKDLRTSEVQPSDLQGECSDWQIKLPFVKAKITSFSRYAVVCRLKNYKLRKEDSGERPQVTISIPDFPGFCLSSPRTSFPASMDLIIKVQELSSDGFEGKRVLVGPVVHIAFTPKVESRDPSQVSLTCPILISVPINSQEHQIKLSEMSSRHVRVFFRGGIDTSRKWVDWTKRLKVPPKLEEGTVTFEVDGADTFQINRFLECGVMLNSSTKHLKPEELFIVDSSCPQHVGFFAFWCPENEKEPRQDPKRGLLTLHCFPLHMKTELKKEISSEHGVLLYGEAKSARQLTKGDQALFSLSNGLTPVDEGIDINYTPVVFTGDFDFKSCFSVRFDAPTIELFKNKKDKEGRERLCSLQLHPVEPFKDHTPVISREMPQLEDKPLLGEASTSVESPADDSGESYMNVNIVVRNVKGRMLEESL